MGKIVDGVELLRMIRDGEIKLNTKIKRTYKNLEDVYYFTGCNLRSENNDLEIGSERLFNKGATYEIVEEIDIENLGEMKNPETWTVCKADIISIVKNVNTLIKAVKQLNKKLEEK